MNHNYLNKSKKKKLKLQKNKTCKRNNIYKNGKNTSKMTIMIRNKEKW